MSKTLTPIQKLEKQLNDVEIEIMNVTIKSNPKNNNKKLLTDLNNKREALIKKLGRKP